MQSTIGMVKVWRLIRINKVLKIGNFLLKITLNLYGKFTSPVVIGSCGSSRSPKLFFLLYEEQLWWDWFRNHNWCLYIWFGVFVEVHSSLEICLQVFLCWLEFFFPCSLISHIQKVKLYLHFFFGKEIEMTTSNVL